MVDGDVGAGMGEAPVDDRPAAGRDAQDRPLAEGFEHVAQGQVGPAALAGQVAGADMLLDREGQGHFLFFFHRFTPIQRMSSVGRSVRLTVSIISRKESAVMSRPPRPAMKAKTAWLPVP